MKHPVTVADWQVELDRLDALSRKQELTDYQSIRLARAIRMVDYNGNPPSPNREWPPHEVETLREMRERNCTFSEIARHLGRHRSSCIGRYHRLVRAMAKAA